MNETKKSAGSGKTSSKPPAISRRSFVERLGLGAGACLLAPIAQTLVHEARGYAAVGERKRAVFFLVGDCFHPINLAPSEFSNLAEPVEGSTNFSMPASFKALEPLRNRVLLIDGLAHQAKLAQHTAGYAALSCVMAADGASNENGGGPGGITLDQYIANGIGGNTRRKSVLIANNKAGNARGTFASGAKNPESAFVDPQAMYKQLFEGLSTGGPMGPDLGAIRGEALLGSLRGDITKLQKALAGPERAKLDNYLALLADYEQRLKTQAPITCGAPKAPGAAITAKSEKEVVLDALFDMATIALVCGVTNVVGVAAGTGHAHLMNNWPNVGHNGAEGVQRAIGTHNFMATRIARMVAALQQVKEGDKTAFDNSVILYTSDNGGGTALTHHTSKDRWPVVIVGNAGGKLKTDGRFIRFPKRGTPGGRSLADLYNTVATAVGVPSEKFGSGPGAIEPVQGPIAGLLA
jgi:hypothetical protein